LVADVTADLGSDMAAHDEPDDDDDDPSIFERSNTVVLLTAEKKFNF